MHALCNVNVFVSVVIVLDYFARVYGTGVLYDPPNRGVMWKYGFSTPRNYDYMNLNCGAKKQHEDMPAECGICGDAENGPRRHEYGGKFGKRTISRWYPAGIKEMRVKVELLSSAKGFFEFRICAANSTPVTQDCLNQNILPIKEGYMQGTPMKFYPKRAGDFHVTVAIPPDLVCDRCVLQWRYHTGNSWGTDPTSRQHGYGQGLQEEFYNCADVRIGGPVPISVKGNMFFSPDNLNTTSVNVSKPTERRMEMTAIMTPGQEKSDAAHDIRRADGNLLKSIVKEHSMTNKIDSTIIGQIHTFDRVNIINGAIAHGVPGSSVANTVKAVISEIKGTGTDRGGITQEIITPNAASRGLHDQFMIGAIDMSHTIGLNPAYGATLIDDVFKVGSGVDTSTLIVHAGPTPSEVVSRPADSAKSTIVMGSPGGISGTSEDVVSGINTLQKSAVVKTVAHTGSFGALGMPNVAFFDTSGANMDLSMAEFKPMASPTSALSVADTVHVSNPKIAIPIVTFPALPILSDIDAAITNAHLQGKTSPIGHTSGDRANDGVFPGSEPSLDIVPVGDISTGLGLTGVKPIIGPGKLGGTTKGLGLPGVTPKKIVGGTTDNVVAANDTPTIPKISMSGLSIPKISISDSFPGFPGIAGSGTIGTITSGMSISGAEMSDITLPEIRDVLGIFGTVETTIKSSSSNDVPAVVTSVPAPETKKPLTPITPSSGLSLPGVMAPPLSLLKTKPVARAALIAAESPTHLIQNSFDVMHTAVDVSSAQDASVDTASDTLGRTGFLVHMPLDKTPSMPKSANTLSGQSELILPETLTTVEHQGTVVTRSRINPSSNENIVLETMTFSDGVHDGHIASGIQDMTGMGIGVNSNAPVGIDTNAGSLGSLPLGGISGKFTLESTGNQNVLHETGVTLPLDAIVESGRMGISFQDSIPGGFGTADAALGIVDSSIMGGTDTSINVGSMDKTIPVSGLTHDSSAVAISEQPVHATGSVGTIATTVGGVNAGMSNVGVDMLTLDQSGSGPEFNVQSGASISQPRTATQIFNEITGFDLGSIPAGSVLEGAGMGTDVTNTGVSELLGQSVGGAGLEIPPGLLPDGGRFTVLTDPRTGFQESIPANSVGAQTIGTTGTAERVVRRGEMFPSSMAPGIVTGPSGGLMAPDLRRELEVRERQAIVNARRMQMGSFGMFGRDRAVVGSGMVGPGIGPAGIGMRGGLAGVRGFSGTARRSAGLGFLPTGGIMVPGDRSAMSSRSTGPGGLMFMRNGGIGADMRTAAAGTMVGRMGTITPGGDAGMRPVAGTGMGVMRTGTGSLNATSSATAGYRSFAEMFAPGSRGFYPAGMGMVPGMVPGRVPMFDAFGRPLYPYPVRAPYPGPPLLIPGVPSFPPMPAPGFPFYRPPGAPLGYMPIPGRPTFVPGRSMFPRRM